MTRNGSRTTAMTQGKGESYVWTNLWSWVTSEFYTGIIKKKKIPSDALFSQPDGKADGHLFGHMLKSPASKIETTLVLPTI